MTYPYLIIVGMHRSPPARDTRPAAYALSCAVTFGESCDCATHHR
jgi:hypothetical protein